MMRAATASLAIAAAFATVGCGPPVADAPGSWAYGPGSMRIHPVTRIASTASVSAGRAQVRVEFVDEDGFTTRAMGRIMVTLEVAGRAPQSQAVNLSDRAANREAWDAATRTYLVSMLPEPPLDRGQAATVRVQWDRVDGRIQRESMQVTAP
jgi:hypothetical protein